MSATIEPYGTTPLPTSSAGSPVRIFFDASSALELAQQPQSQHIAGYASSPSELGGSLLAVNPHFVVYAVKEGLIRVLHRQSTMRSLLRAHKGMSVTDIQFFQDGDILATAAHTETASNLVIWRVYERSPEVTSDILLEVRTQHFCITRVVWHPFNPNQFWMLHSTGQQQKTVATLVESTRITTHPHETEPHSVCHINEDMVIMDGAIQVANSNANLTDLCWSNRENRHVLTAFDNGEIILWDMKQLQSNNNNRLVAPYRLCSVEDDGPVSTCLFLPYENAVGKPAKDLWTTCFVTGSDKNRVITLWSAFGPNSNPTKLQVFGLENPSSSYLLDVCSGPAPADASPPSSFLVLADRTKGEMYAWHCRSIWNEDPVAKTKMPHLVGCDYVVPFQTRQPVYSWSVEVVATTDISEEELSEQGSLVFDMKIFGCQPADVQALTLTSYMCLPPENSWLEPTEGVRVERLVETHSAHVSEIGSTEDDLQYDEAYDLEDEEDAAEDDYEIPDASTLPTPAGFEQTAKAQTLVNNPFANWLGAIAANNSSVPVPPPPLPKASAASLAPVSSQPPPASAPAPPLAPPAPTFLSPMDILKSATEQTTAQTSISRSREITPTTSNSKARKKSPAGSTKTKETVAQPHILKRKEEPLVASTISAEAVSSMDGALPADDLRRAIREEIQASVMPQLRSMLEEALKSTVTGPLQSSLRQLKAEADATTTSTLLNVDNSLKACFAETVRNVMIPTMESVSNQILSKVSDHLETTSAKSQGSNQELEVLSKQLTAMSSLVTKLTSEVQALKKIVNKQNQQASPQAITASTNMPVSSETVKKEILAMLHVKNYMGAFTKAVSASTAETALFCCSNADINAVLGGNSPELSQAILLCLMQQLGTFLGSATSGENLQLALQWLQEISLSLNPSDSDIAQHVPAVLQQLVAGINARMAQNDPNLKRPLQRLLQAIRGMQIG